MHLTPNSIYPGEYVAPRKHREMMNELREMKNEEIIHPIADIAEMPNSYKIEMVIPGMKREEILINVNKDILSIYASHRQRKVSGKHHFNQELMNRGVKIDIRLPKNAGAEFASAEYKGEILSVHFQKMSKPAKSKSSKIIVY